MKKFMLIAIVLIMQGCAVYPSYGGYGYQPYAYQPYGYYYHPAPLHSFGWNGYHGWHGRRLFNGGFHGWWHGHH